MQIRGKFKFNIVGKSSKITRFSKDLREFRKKCLYYQTSRQSIEHLHPVSGLLCHQHTVQSHSVKTWFRLVVVIFGGTLM